MSNSQTWLFRTHEWAKIPDPLGDASDWEAALREHGYPDRPDTVFGTEEFSVGVHPATADVMAPYPFVVVVSLPSRYYPIYVQDLPALLELLTQLMPTVEGSLRTMFLAADAEDLGEEPEAGGFDPSRN